MSDHYEMQIGDLKDELEVANEEIDKLKDDLAKAEEILIEVALTTHRNKKLYDWWCNFPENKESEKTEINCKTIKE